MGLVAAFRLEFRGVGIRLVNVAGLHRQEFLLRGLAVRALDFGDKVHQLYRVAATDVVYFVRNAVRALFRDRQVVERMHATLGDVVDVGEVADHVTVVEHLDGLALRDGAGKEHRAHVGLNFLLFLLAAYKLTGLSTLSSSLYGTFAFKP